MGPKAREQSVHLILDKIKSANTDNLPLVLMGDLNDMPESKPIQILKSHLQDTHEISESNVYGPKGTFNGFKTDKIINQRIDYIFTSKFKVLSHRHIDDRLDDGQFISDHLPVFIHTQLNN
jgi:endonuclease/exonuclease/phosphatase family metal-dependent hydrolase